MRKYIQILCIYQFSSVFQYIQYLTTSWFCQQSPTLCLLLTSLCWTFLTCFSAQLPVVISEHVRTCFNGTQSQEFNSEVRIYEFYAAMCIKTHLDSALYLSSVWSENSSDSQITDKTFSKKRRERWSFIIYLFPSFCSKFLIPSKSED